MIDSTYNPIIPADYKSQRERTSLRSLSLGTVLAFYVNSRLLVAQILVDGLGASLPAPIARMTVAAPVTASPPAYTLTGGQTILVDDDTALLVDLQALGGGLDQGVGGGTQRHDDSVHIQLELAALLLHGRRRPERRAHPAPSPRRSWT